MLATAGLTLLALFASVALTLAGKGAPLAVTHLAFAVGIVPLIFAAMLHFVPVLTRTGNPGRGLRLLPTAAQIIGLLVVAALQGLLPYWVLHPAALSDLLLALVLLSWIVVRARAALGRPHPGWRWYTAALACLILALAAVLGMLLWPQQWPALRLFHLHLNTLGLVGLAALGTLPVLLPTACVRPDPAAGAWLGRWLWPAFSGVVLIAGGSAWHWTLAAAGSGLLLAALLSLLWQWKRVFGWCLLLADGVTCSLLAATGGLALTLIAGLAHGLGLMSARLTLSAWVFGFLLPLVSGALSQLLPVWRWPGPQLPARLEMRCRLAVGGGWRALLFFAAAALALAGFERLAVAGAAAALLLFAAALLRAMRVRRMAR
ncbi:MAG: hypothetical protein LBE81_01055 [Azonexus sp.]|uniref:hypothetical protein n=1 Tax=Azonexus sp. TaxID=1872668 RepID=UPI00282CF4C1|nr:hypothetical protein [Azonexus sp.]MDR0775215.1 hypothetical protein [Azonexus sp.]